MIIESEHAFLWKLYEEHMRLEEKGQGKNLMFFIRRSILDNEREHKNGAYSDYIKSYIEHFKVLKYIETDGKGWSRFPISVYFTEKGLEYFRQEYPAN